jgi:AraC family transcriptional regulator of adaptative response/methylated-DNA-[protein]-cysteine methyltransferase
MPATVIQTRDPRWRAIQRRDRGADGTFWYGVRTTGVYCRPCCSSRRPRRENIELFDTWTAAERGGYRACKKCRPNQPQNRHPVHAAVAQACEILQEADSPPKLAALARQVGLSPFHLQRLFKQTLGISPKVFARSVQSGRFKGELSRQPTVTRALYKAGYESTSRGYDRAREELGMTPGQYRRGGAGQIVRYAIAPCTLGFVLVAATQRGICLIALGDTPKQLDSALKDRLHKADCRPAGEDFQNTLAKVVALIDNPSGSLDLPLDIQGTAFQRRVWEALQKVPAGKTVTYAELARRIGCPRAVRAVAGAVAANRLAVAIPCHRAVRADGHPSGYRWGLPRKASLQAREAADS